MKTAIIVDDKGLDFRKRKFIKQGLFGATLFGSALLLSKFAYADGLIFGRSGRVHEPAGAGGGGANHDILDGDVHQDSVADSVTRGSLIYGNSTPKWDELVIGSAETVLQSDGTDVAWKVHERTISITIESPTSSEDLVLGFFFSAVTIKEVQAGVRGSATPSVTIQLFHNTDRSAAGNAVLNPATSITNTTTGQTLSTFTDADLPVNSWLWLETTTTSGTVNELYITVRYVYD